MLLRTPFIASLLALLTVGTATAEELTNIQVAQSGPNLVLTAEASPDLSVDQVVILIRSGVQPPGYIVDGRPAIQFDLAVRDSVVSQFMGKTSRDWEWVPLGRARGSIKDNHYRIEIPIKLIGVGRIDLGVWRIDQGPRKHPLTVAHDDAFQTIELQPDPAIEKDLTFAPPRPNRNLPPRERFRRASNYYLFYGAGRVAELSRYDVAVLHTPAMTPQNVKKLNEQGVVTIGYITVGEDDELRAGNGKGPDGKASWYVDKDHDGKPDQNGIWKSWYANASDPAWRANRLAEAHKLVDDYGFDGFFLDTTEMPDIYPEARPGMIQLIEDLRRGFPQKVIVANRAFSLLKEARVTSSIDAILYESFSSHYDFDEKHYVRFTRSDLDGTRAVIRDHVEPVLKTQPNFRVLALDYTDPDDREWIQVCFDRAATFGFLPCVGPIFLDDVYSTSDFVGRPDQKYLKRLATSESMRFTLNEPRNGFPAGTIVEPSSCFGGYTAAPTVDGIKDRGKLHWSKSSWASEEEAEDHSLALLLGKPTSGGKLLVKYTLAPVKYRVEVRLAGRDEWNVIAQSDANRGANLEIPLPGESLKAVRIIQPSGGGNHQRPNLMWIEQVEIVP